MSDLVPPLASDDLPPEWQEKDAIESYYAAIAAIGELVRNGAPIPSTGYFGTARPR